MPELILFAPCHMAILDKDDGTVSLISVLHGLTFNVPSNNTPLPIPPNAVSPMTWAAVSIWLNTEGDGDKTFEQKVEIFLPSGQSIGTHSELPFKMTHRTHHLVVRGEGFPIGETGVYKVALFLREVGQGQEWQVINEYPVEIKHKIITEI